MEKKELIIYEKMNRNELRAARLARFGSPAVQEMDFRDIVPAAPPDRNISEHRNMFFGPTNFGDKRYATTSTSGLDNVHFGENKRFKKSEGGRKRRTRRHKRTKRRRTCRCRLTR